jgi:hypothetical protein
MSRPDRLHVAAAAAVVAVVARVASILLWPPDSDASHAKMLATASAHHTAWELATAAETVAWLTAGFAVLTALSLVVARGWWLTRVGGWLYGVSLLALGFVGSAMNDVTGVIAREPGRDAMVAVQDHLHAPVLDAMVMLVLLGELCSVVFAAGLARARLVGWWYPVVSLVAVAAYVVTSDSSAHVVVLAGFVPLAVTWLVLARLMAGRLAVAPVPVPATA